MVHETGGVDISCVTLDCADPVRVAEFWNAALGSGGVAVAPDGVPPPVAARYRNVILRDPEGNEFCLSGGSLA